MIGNAIPWGIKLDRQKLAVDQFDRIETSLDAVNPCALVHLASLDLRQCEKDPYGAYRINVLGTYHLACYAHKKKLPFVYLSSATVFNGPLGARFDEDAKPDAINIYGQTKQLSEILIQKTLTRFLIMRTGWVFGGHGAHHEKFVDVSIEKAKKGELISASIDQEGSPTYIHDLIATLTKLLEEDKAGIYHVVNDGTATAADMAELIVQTFNSSSFVDRTSAKAISQSSGGALMRSPSEVLISKKLKLRHWKEALSEYVRKN